MCPAWGVFLSLTSCLPHPPSPVPRCGHRLMPASPRDTRPHSAADACPLVSSLETQAWSCHRPGTKTSGQSCPGPPPNHCSLLLRSLPGQEGWPRRTAVRFRPRHGKDRAQAFPHSPAVAALCPRLTPNQGLGTGAAWQSLCCAVLHQSLPLPELGERRAAGPFEHLLPVPPTCGAQVSIGRGTCPHGVPGFPHNRISCRLPPPLLAPPSLQSAFTSVFSADLHNTSKLAGPHLLSPVLPVGKLSP